MKNIILILTLFFTVINLNSQVPQKPIVDTTKMCIPYNVVQQILLDLNEYDKLKEIVLTYENEIHELNGKIILQKKETEFWKEENKLNKEIISEKQKSVKIYKEENINLAKENKRLKTKNTLFNIIAGIIIAPLTYALISK